ncbi:MAG: DUF4491 family protein [Eubacteriales bacterium]|nr:DUF4491 family protein [Eubacteriales bacterium]
MNFTGIIIGVTSFLSIGVFHPIVIKAEYYFSKRVWPVFAIVGAILLIISTQLVNVVAGAALAVIGMSCFWSIHELYEQEERVRKGWFPKNPKRKDYT